MSRFLKFASGLLVLAGLAYGLQAAIDGGGDCQPCPLCDQSCSRR